MASDEADMTYGLIVVVCEQPKLIAYAEASDADTLTTLVGLNPIKCSLS
jgi:hypothetical protein